MDKKVDMNSIIKAFKDNQNELVHFFDKHRGEIISLALQDPDLQAIRKLKDKITLEPGRYPQIIGRSSHEKYKDMEDFIKTVKDIKLQSRLIEAIVGQGAFKGFRDVMEAYPKERQRWNAYNDELLKNHIKDFFKSNGITYKFD